MKAHRVILLAALLSGGTAGILGLSGHMISMTFFGVLSLAVAVYGGMIEGRTA